MNPILTHRLAAISVRPARRHHNLVAFPLEACDLPDPGHIMLVDALGSGFLTVEEIGKGGSVPELAVYNDSDHYVLMLDGEELAGAKQNRVLNTTILLEKRSHTMIPVSCTEQGRWAYNSPSFSHSGNIMSSKLRNRKARSVSQSLNAGVSFQSDQGDVWEGIAELHADAKTHSSTGAMKDAFEARREGLAGFVEVLAPEPGQIGLLTFIDGKPAGCDLFATHSSFARISEQLVRSYAMDAITSRSSQGTGGIGEPEAKAFLSTLPRLAESDFDSVGLGRDYRYEGPEGSGFALIVGDTPVHASFFAAAGDDRARHPGNRPRIASLSARRSSRERRDNPAREGVSGDD
jgi:hypothetical protein